MTSNNSNSGSDDPNNSDCFGSSGESKNDAEFQPKDGDPSGNGDAQGEGEHSIPNSEESSADELPGYDPSSDDSAPKPPRKDPLIGKHLGPYKILQALGAGGMGTVYMADQEKPIQRRVALKVIKEKKDSEQVLLRFEAERQALAMMSHENISKVLDAGEDLDRPYFAMELVKGIPITQYCDTNRLPIDERLKLFVAVCNAIQHAHQKGIIHRDLKPTNILVEEVDGVPVPKVIDFGLAKALNTQAKLTDETFFTEFGRVVGTVHYMSPEQAEMNQLDVDTRTDIYSLGVILYELLTGTRPLDDETIKQNVFLKILELIREQEPERPSSRVSDSNNSEIDFGKQRRVSTSKLQQTLKGDLDWIVMKSLEKDRSRRYATASDFGGDVQNYLAGDAVTARKPTLAYKLSKFTKKNVAAVVTTAVVLTIVLVSLVVISANAFELNQLVKEKEGLIGEKSEALNEKEIAIGERDKALGEKDAALVVAKQKTDEANYKNVELEQAKKQLSNTYEAFKRAQFGSSGPLMDSVGLRRVASMIFLTIDSAFNEAYARQSVSWSNLVVKHQSSRRLWQKEIAISKSGRFLATGDLVTGAIRIWDTQTKKLLGSWEEHEMPEDRGGFWPTVSGIEFDPKDESIIYSCGLDGFAWKWNWETGDALRIFGVDDSQFTSLLVDGSGETPTVILSATTGELIKLDTTKWTVVTRKKVTDQRINDLAISPHGNVVAVGQKGTVLTCDSEFENLRSAKADLPDLLCSAWAPDGNRFAVGDTEGRITVFDLVELGRVKQFSSHAKGSYATDDLKKVRTLFWFEGGLLSGGSDGLIKKWSPDFELEFEYKGHGPNVYGRDDVMGVVATKDQCFSIGRDHTTRAWNLKSGKCTHSLQGNLFPHQVFHPSDYARFSYHPDTNQLLTATDAKDAYARLWNVDSLTEINKYKNFPIQRFIDESGGPQTLDIAFSTDGKRFAVAEPTGQISIWALDGSSPKTFKAHEVSLSGNPRDQYMRVKWSKDDLKIYSIANDQKLKVWNSSDFKLEKEYEVWDPVDREDSESLPALLVKEMDARNKRSNFDHQLENFDNGVITAGQDDYVRFWNLSDGKLEQKINIGNRVTYISVSNDHSLLAVGTETGVLSLIELTSKRIIGSHNLDHYAVDQFAFGTGKPNNIRNWFGENEFKVWNQSIKGISFSPNNRILAVSTGNGVLSVIKSTGEILHRAFNYDKFDRSWRQQLPFFTQDGRLFTVGADQAIREWDLYDIPAKTIAGESETITQLIADKDSDRIIQIGLPEKTDDYVWEKEEGKWTSIPFPEELKDVTSAAFIPRSEEILLGTFKGRAIRFNYKSNEIKLEFKGKDDNRSFGKPIGAFLGGSLVSCSFNGGLAATTWTENAKHTIDIWDLESGDWMATIPTKRGIEAMVFHPSNKELAYTNEVGEYFLVDLEQARDPFDSFNGKGPQFARGLQFSADNQLLVQAGEYYNNRLISLWNPKTGSEIDPVTGLDSPSRAITVKQNDLFDVDPVISQGGNRKVAYRDVACSPDGKWLATAGKDGFLVLWQVDGKKVYSKCKVPLNTLRLLIGDLNEKDAFQNTSMEHTGLENVEFSSDSQTIYCSLKTGPITMVKVSKLVELAERSAEEKLADYSELVGLKIEGTKAVNIERNHMVPVAD